MALREAEIDDRPVCRRCGDIAAQRRERPIWVRGGDTRSSGRLIASGNAVVSIAAIALPLRAVERWRKQPCGPDERQRIGEEPPSLRQRSEFRALLSGAKRWEDEG